MKENNTFFEGKWYIYPLMRNVLIAGILIGTAFVSSHLGVIPSHVEIAIYIVAIVLGGYHWVREGIEKLIEEKKIGIEILMMAATIGSAILGMWDEAAFLVFLYGSAEGIEEYAYDRTRGSIRKLLDLAPKEACVIRDGKQETILAEKLLESDIILVKPGESIPTDGVIIEGKTSINEAPVTGESIPVEKKEGMKVYAATINQEGSLKIGVTTSFKNNTLSKMIHLVEEAQEQKGKSQIFIESFGNKYTPLVLLSALFLIVFPFFWGLSITTWATKAVVLLVAAAPCALVMSTPVAIAAGIGKAGRNGVLIKGGVHLENLGKIKAVAFDKTGTLTEGNPVITDIITSHSSESEVLQLASSVEKLSEHPLAKAILIKAEENDIKPFSASDFTSISGYGAKAIINGTTIYVGKQGLFEKFGLTNHEISQIEKFRQEGKTIIFVGTESIIYGIIAIRDKIRPNAKTVIEILHKMGIKVAILTGDNRITANAIAKELEIDDVRADLKPDEKLEAIKELEKQYKVVAMIGDGINDAPALARATVGIAMGAAGTDAAIEAADIALMSDDLNKVLYALSLGRRAKSISNQNIVFSLIILLILIPSALIGILSVAIAIFFHETSELLAVVNGLRVARV